MNEPYDEHKPMYSEMFIRYWPAVQYDCLGIQYPGVAQYWADVAFNFGFHL